MSKLTQEFLSENLGALVDAINLDLNTGELSEVEVSERLTAYSTYVLKILEDLGRVPKNRHAIVDSQLRTIGEVMNYDWRVGPEEPHSVKVA